MPDPTPPARPLTLRGRIMHALAPDRLDLHEDAVLIVDAAGGITGLHASGSALHGEAIERAQADGTLLSLAPEQILLPGLVDLHVHAPQWPQAGRALHVPLERWLQDHTFPLESRYADIDFAREIYADLVACLLANGTTTAVYFATIHEASSLELARLCIERGQRAAVGRVAMDDAEQCPAFYRDQNADAGIAATRRFIEAVRALPGNETALVRPMVTPRFIPSCSDALLAGLGSLAAELRCAVQTHCSESDWEHSYVADRMGRSDTASLDAFGLLRPGSILAHGNYIADDDADLIRARGAAIAHCPISNVFFADAVFPLRRFLERRVHVGLGTDIAGGYSPSILDNARQAMIASRLLESGTDPQHQAATRGRGQGQRIDHRAAFWLATAAGGEALGLPIGMFSPGYRFDAILLDTASPNSNIRLRPGDTGEEILERVVCHAARSDIARVWVDGRVVV